MSMLRRSKIKYYLNYTLQGIRNLKPPMRFSFSNGNYHRKKLVDVDKILISNGAIQASLQRLSHDKFRKLNDAEFKVFSQWGEDGILNYICDILSLDKPKIIEIGASNFIECNSRFLAEYRNASVYALDYNPELIDNVSKMDIYWKNHIFPVVDFITPENIESHVIQARNLMGGLDIVSIDIDGNDYWCLANINLDGVTIVVAEINPLFGDEINVTIPRSDFFDRRTAHYSQLYFGMSMRALSILMEKNNFVLIGTNSPGNNAFFVRNCHVSSFQPLLLSGSFNNTTLDWRVRESRDKLGSLNYLSGQNRLNEILECEVVDLNTNKLVTLGSVLQN